MEVGLRQPVSLILHMATLQLLKNLCRLDLELVLGQILRPLAHPLWIPYFKEVVGILGHPVQEAMDLPRVVIQVTHLSGDTRVPQDTIQTIIAT